VRQAELDREYTKALLVEKGIDCKTHLRIRGFSQGKDLVQFVAENRINEIFVGVRRRSKIGKVLMGSTAQHFIFNAPRPVVSVI